MTKPRLTIFSWGYRGWGNSTEQFVEAIDKVEASRGFAPLLFVEVRIRRSGRAIGFCDDAFADLLGSDRYVWMKDLGNNAVITRRGPRIQIANPTAAYTLVEFAVNAAKRKRRVIFFCACAVPASCHRAEVAQLVSAAAHRRSLDAEVIEWPGGDPCSTELLVPESVVAKVQRGAKSIPIGDTDITRFAGLPWYSRVTLRSPGRSLNTFCSPAAHDSRAGWHLKVLELSDAKLSESATRSEAVHLRMEGGYAAVS